MLPTTLDQELKLAKNQSVLMAILHGLPLHVRKMKNIRQHLILGACLTCLLPTGAMAYDVKTVQTSDMSGQTLLFANIQTAPSVADESSSSNNNVPAPRDIVDPVDDTMGQPVVFSPETIEPKSGQLKDTENLISPDDPVDLLADRVEYDEIAGIVSAIGNVELAQTGRILRADLVTYNLNKDQVQAEGNVILNEPTGDTYFADDVELKDKMKDGFVTGLRGVLADGSRFTAQEAEKIADLKVIMNVASYTPCEPCKNNPEADPFWQIKADKVTHHKDEQRVAYEDATFEVYGTPVGYLPYFSHPDGSVKRKSGFLTPSVGFDSTLGGVYRQDYYWSIAPDKDLTVGTEIFTKEAPLLTAEYRQRFSDAEILASGGVTYSARTDRSAGRDLEQDDEERGHLFVEGLWNIDDKWRAGTALELVSDEQYLRQYNISSEDILENKIYLERFSGRDYGTGRLIKFKDVRVSDRRVDQPSVLPEIYTRFLGDPNGLLGGRWSLEASALALQREGSDQDLARGTLEAGWQGRKVMDFGLVNTLDLTARGDAYRANDRDIIAASSNLNRDSTALRGFTQAHLQTSLPFSKNLKSAQMVIEPLVSTTIGSNLNVDDDIPNEDSLDVFLDSTNIFNANRFPGYDRIEDKSFATYGVRTGLYGDNGYHGEIFLGQSYRFDDKDNPFLEGSGLSEQESDFVGNISANLGEKFRINYGMQLANDNLASRRHEIDASGKIGKLSLGTRYFYADSLQGTDLNESREQIRNSARYSLNDRWAVYGATQYDLAPETEGLRKLSYGLDYQGQCVTFLLGGERKLTKDSTGDSGTEIMMRIGLKNLGEFATSGLSVGSEE